MPGGQGALHQHLPDGRREGGEAQGIGDGGTGLAHPLGHFLLGHTVVGEQEQVALRLLHRVEILPLEVLNQAQLHDLSVVRLQDYRWDLGQPSQLRGAPAPLPSDDLIVA